MKKSIFSRLALAAICFFLNVQMQAQTTIFCEDFESGSLDPMFWTTSPSINGVVQHDTDDPQAGTTCLIMGKTVDAGGFQTQKLDLHLNLQGSSAKDIELTFWHLDYYDETQPEDGLFFSNGGPFVKVLDFRPSDYCDETWGQFPPIDVDSLAKAKLGANWATSQFVIRFQQHDDGDFGGNNADGLFLDEICVEEVPKTFFKVLPGQEFSDDFESCQLGNSWAWRFADQTNTLAAVPTRPSNYVGVQSDFAFNSQCALLFGKRCDDDGGFATNALDLMLDLSGTPQAELSFWYLDYYDETQADDGLYFSNDGGANFKKALDFKPSEYCNEEWGQFPPIDIDELAAKIGLNFTPNFIIRFQQHDDSDLSGNNADGLYIDDLTVRVPPKTFAALPFKDGFETGKLEPMWSWRWPDSVTTTLATVPTRPSNFVGVQSDFAFSGQYSLLFAKRCDDGFGTNALDLRLNLASTPQVEMRFWMYNYYDETQADDGLYFSNDGGKTFKKAFSFDPTKWCAEQWGRLPPLDIDELAAKIGLPFTAEFVIRFQQHDDSDLSGNNADGFYIDDVEVYASKIQYVGPQFFDDFETGKFGPAWSPRFAETIDPNVPPPFSKLSNYLEVDEDSGHNSQYGVSFGKRCDDGFATNALDLHLNLLGVPNVKLWFDLLDYYDDAHPQDGLFGSDNGGISFKKLADFNFAALPDNVWLPAWPANGFNIGALAAAQGLSFTDKFILRFQQHDDSDFSGNNADGMSIDNVNLTITTATDDAGPASKNGLLVSPNPTAGQVQIQLPDGFQEAEIEWDLFDFQGKSIDFGKSPIAQTGFEMELSGCSPGLYLLRIQSARQVWETRILKN